jgi:ligand-binding sensor domain-containing protein
MTKNLQYFSTQEGFISNSVFAINEDHQGNMWFGTDQGVYQYNGKTFRNFNQKDGLQHIDISRRSILVDKSGKIWVGTHRGVYQYDAEADQQGKPSFSVFSLLPEINTADIFEDKSGNIWFATSNQGVFKYDGKTITNFNEKAQLGENYAGGIAQDPAGNMWFVFKNGICKYDGKTFTEYTSKDGLGGTEFWGILIEKSGIIWITARGSNTRLIHPFHYQTLKHLVYLLRQTGLPAVCKACSKINLVKYGGVLVKDSIILIKQDFIR